jgi:hypothetical protein
LLLALTNTLPIESFSFSNLLSVFKYYCDYFLYIFSLEVDIAWFSNEDLKAVVSEYCFIKAELGGQAARDRGSTRGKGVSVKKLSFKT